MHYVLCFVFSSLNCYEEILQASEIVLLYGKTKSNVNLENQILGIC